MFSLLSSPPLKHQKPQTIQINRKREERKVKWKKPQKKSFRMKSYKNTINKFRSQTSTDKVETFRLTCRFLVYKLKRIKTFLHWLTERTNIEWTSRLHLRLANKKKRFSSCCIFSFLKFNIHKNFDRYIYVESTHIEHGTARKKRIQKTHFRNIQARQRNSTRATPREVFM